MAQNLAKELKFYGPFFFQAIEDEEGVPRLTEINPRIAGIMSLSSSSGVNIHSLAVRMCMGEEIEIPKINYGLFMTRYFEDIFLMEKDIENKIEEI